MNYKVIYTSVTGNTKALAKAIKNIEPRQCLYCGAPETDREGGAELIFAGFWTDKGICPDSLKNYFEKLHGKQIFLFGTAGFGESEEYFQNIIHRVSQLISGDNEIIGSFMCQGRMPETVRKRYELMAEKEPDNENIQRFLENYEKALSHPDANDLAKLKEMARLYIGR